jgi:phosphoribosyl 1,2-cyclic phosphodiesterase
VPGPATVGFGGNTTCLEVRAGGHLIILDAGTGIIGLGRELLQDRQVSQRPIIATILFTHTHNDHTQGFPFFQPAMLPSSTLYMFGPRMFDDDLESALARAMLPSVFPIELDELPSMRAIHSIRSGTRLVLDDPADPPQICRRQLDCPPTPPSEVEIRALRSYAHPKGGVFIYKITFQGKQMVFATDTEDYRGTQTVLTRFARGADLLIHDAQYTWDEYVNGAPPKQGWGHSTWEMATEVAARARVKQLILTHHDPLCDDAALEETERLAQGVFANCRLAREGMTIEL